MEVQGLESLEGICFRSALLVHLHLEAWVRPRGTLYENTVQGGQLGWWKTQHWLRGATGGSGEVSLEQRRLCVKCLPSGEESDPEGSVGERSPRKCYTGHIPRGFKLSE